MRNGSTSLATVINNHEVVGAGGWTTGLAVANDETLLGRNDTAGAVRRDPGSSVWVRELVPGETIAAADVVGDAGIGVWDVEVAPSNSAVRYLATMGYVLVKKPGATLYTRTALPRRLTMNANAANRMNGKMLTVDPVNPAVCWAGMPEGVFFTTDYGDSWTTISTSTLPAPTVLSVGNPNRHIIIFDRSSSVVSGRTQRLYIFVPGSGWYHSTNAGATWALIAGSPTSAGLADIHPTSGLLISTGALGEANGPVNIWNGTAWSTGQRIGGAALELHCVVFDPLVANRIYGIQTSGFFSVSNDNGVNWGDYSTPTQTAETVDIPWQVSDSGYRSIGRMVRGPVSGALYISAGIGCWTVPAPLPTTSDFTIPLPWVGISRGIENMVCTTLFRAPDGKAAIIMQDKQCMLFGPLEIGRSFTNSYGPRRGQILRGIAADYAPEDTDFWVVTFVEEGAHCGFTTDFGNTWTLRPQLRAQTGGNGAGQIVVLSKDVWIAGQFSFGTIGAATRTQNALYITRDRGLTWTEIVIGNGNGTVAQYGSNQIRISMCKDPYTPGRVFFYNCSDVGNPDSADSVACRGIYMIDVDLGSSAAPVVTRLRDTRVFIPGDSFHLKLRHGGAANTFVLCGGNNTSRAYRGVVSGTSLTLTELTGTDNLGLGTRFGEVESIAVGKGRNGSSTPSIWVAGYRVMIETADDGVDFSRFGLWESMDLGATWVRRDQFPGKVLPGMGGNDVVLPDICSSMHRSGEVTVSTLGQGAVHRFERYTLRAS